MRGKPVIANTLVFSYLTLRKVVGLLGTALPFVLFLGGLLIFGRPLQSSMSAYYYTQMRDVFVGTLWAIGFFLLSYQGYGLADSIAAKLACVFAVGVSLFPTTPDLMITPAQQTVGYVHAGFAAAMFITLIYFSMVLFTKTSASKKPTRRKRLRNKVYVACGIVMAICIFVAVLQAALPQFGVTVLNGHSLLFWMEAFSIVAFGVSWIVKGEWILKDE
jgi:hypothetical protein